MASEIDLSEEVIRRRVEAALRQSGTWIPGTEILSYLGLARLRIHAHGHIQYRIDRLPLIGLEDPGIQRLMLGDALHDILAERYPSQSSIFLA